MDSQLDGQGRISRSQSLLVKYRGSERASRVRASICSMTGYQRKQKAEPLGHYFVQRLLLLPTELHIMILEQLDLKNLLQLRLISKDFHALVDSCVSALVRNYAKSLNPLHLMLYPPPNTGLATIKYIIENEHRLGTSHALATLISDFFCDKMLGVRSARKRKAFEETYHRITRGLEPLFFTLGHFFENYRQIILERAMKQWRPGQTFQISTGGPTVWDDQVSILNRYSPNLMLDCYHAYGYLLQVFEYQLRPSRMQRFLRSVRNLSTEPAATREVEVLLMLGGMEQVCHVLKERSYGRRRDALDAFIHRLKPTTNPQWRDLWDSLGVAGDDIQLDKVPSLRLRLPALHLVWVPSALKILLCNKIIDRVDFSADTASPMDFVFDLLGYDAVEDGDWDEEDEEDEDDDDYGDDAGDST